MIIQELDRYYRRLLEDPQNEAPAAGWGIEKASWEIGLSLDGRVTGVSQLMAGTDKNIRKFIGVCVPEHGARSGTGLQPFFLCDNAAYLLGLDDKNGVEKRRASRELHRAVLEGCDDEAAAALLRFFDRDDVLDAVDDARKEELKSGGFAVFRVEGEHVDRLRIHERPAVVSAWNAFREGGEVGETIAQCSVTGKRMPIDRLFPQVTGVPGAQSAGASIVSFNCDSFESYGKKQAYNASISKEVSFNAGSALKYLYRHRDHHVRVGDTMVLFWTDRKALEEMELFRAMCDPDGLISGASEDKALVDRIGNAFASMAKGMPIGQSGFDGDTRFFILGLSPNAARLSVRFFETDTLDRLMRNYGIYLHETSMVDVKICSLRSMLLQVAPLGKDEEIPSTLVSACFSAMLKGDMFPQSLYSSILSRMRCDHAAKNPWDMGRRAAVLKACLMRKQRLRRVASQEGSLDVSLNNENHNEGYVLGRLFAVMERAQKGALGDVNATIRDKYIGAASTTPARVFPLLFQLTENHISKLRKVSPGLGVIIEKTYDSIFEVMDGARSMPKTLTADEQGQFFIGYYQQRADLWKKKQPEGDTASSSGETQDLD